MSQIYLVFKIVTIKLKKKIVSYFFSLTDDKIAYKIIKLFFEV